MISLSMISSIFIHLFYIEQFSSFLNMHNSLPYIYLLAELLILLMHYFLDVLNILLMVILNYLVIPISVSLGSALSYSFVWIMFPFVFISLSLYVDVGIYTVDENTTSPSLHGLVSYRRISSIHLGRDFISLSNPCAIQLQTLFLAASWASHVA